MCDPEERLRSLLLSNGFDYEDTCLMFNHSQSMESHFHCEIELLPQSRMLQGAVIVVTVSYPFKSEREIKQFKMLKLAPL